MTLNPITVQAEGNWLDEANAQKVLNHAGARTVIQRDELINRGVTSVKEALRTVPGIQAPENVGTAGSDASLSIGVRGLTSRFSPRSGTRGRCSTFVCPLWSITTLLSTH